MSKLEIVKKYFHPVQPGVKPTETDVIYREYKPVVALGNVIYCYWELKTKARLKEPFIYRVVADGCIDFFLDASNPAESYVMGFCRKFTEFAMGDSFNYVGIRFYPAMFSHMFRIDSRRVSNSYYKLDTILPEFAASLVQNLHPDTEFAESRKIFDNLFLPVLAKREFDLDPRFYDALGLILKNHGVLKIESDLDTGIGARQLQRMFNYYLGTSPKAFCKIMRFQHVLRFGASAESIRNDKIFFDAGYFDQSHFIKDFKAFYGVTPKEAFS